MAQVQEIEIILDEVMVILRMAEDAQICIHKASKMGYRGFRMHFHSLIRSTR